jgi:hypothetical protein
MNPDDLYDPRECEPHWPNILREIRRIRRQAGVREAQRVLLAAAFGAGFAIALTLLWGCRTRDYEIAREIESAWRTSTPAHAA